MTAKPVATKAMVIAVAKYYPSIHDGHGSQRHGKCNKPECVLKTGNKAVPHFAMPQDRFRKAIAHLKQRGYFVPLGLNVEMTS